jgi:diguanylate cyclase (GGDEF)-like protein
MNTPSPQRLVAGPSPLADLSHALHTQLNGVLGMSELLMETALDPAQRGYVETLTRAGRRLQSVIRDVLDLARIETGQIQLAQREFDLMDRLETMLDAAAEHAETAGLELAGDLALDLPYRVIGDPNRFERLLSYLIEDLIDLTSVGELVVRATWLSDSASDRLRVEILASQAAGFELPAGSVGTWTGSAAGSGLGLTVARAWVECMGGTIQFEPESLDGRLTWVELPLTVASSERRRHLSIGSLAGRRVLLLAPEGLMAQTLDARLNDLGLRVSRATEVETARLAVCEAAGSEVPFAALLVDARIKGLEPLLSERSIQAEPALAALQRLLLVPRRSGWRDDQAAALAVTAQLAKPVTPGAVLAALTGVGAEPIRAESWIFEDEPPAAPSRDGLGLRVLVADDNAINQETVTAMLRSLGCESRLVFDGQAAIEALSRESFDLVLMDCKMPLMDGYEAARRIRLQEGESRTRLPIIALTAHTLEGDQERCRAAGMDDYLTKPLSRRALRAMLERWSPRRWDAAPTEAEPEFDSGPLYALSTGIGAFMDWPILDPGPLDRVRALDANTGSTLLVRLIDGFIEAEPGLSAALRSALETCRSAPLTEAARALGASAATLGLKRLAGLCEHLEHLPESALTPRMSAEIIATLEALLVQSRAAVESLADRSATDSASTADPNQSRGSMDAPDALDGAPQRRPVEAPARTRIGSDEHPSILMIDADPVLESSVHSQLAQSELQIVFAHDDQSALESVARRRPDLILLDLMGPGLNGHEICRRLRQYPGLELSPILALIENEDHAAIERAYEAGATDFQVKPLNWPLLLHRIRYLLRGQTTLEALHRSEASQSALIAAIPDALLRLDSQGRVLQFKSGWLPGQARARPESSVSTLSDLLPESACAVIQRELAATLVEHGVRELEIEVTDEHDEPRVFEARLIAIDADQIILLLRDMTERQRRQRVIQQLAYQDSLTGLANRRRFNLDLARALAHARRRDDRLALLCLDLDRFKRVNDSLGHGIGDELLRVAAQRLQDAVDEVGTALKPQGIAFAGAIARLGGDELTLILKGRDAERIAMRVADTILNKFRQPFRLGGHSLVCTASIGIALSPDDGDTPEILLKHADTALYAAKLQGRDTYRFFTAPMGERVRQRLETEARLRHALEHDEFRLHYQPILDSRTRAPIALEALLRWEDREQGLREPESFIPVADESGLILPIGAWVITEIGRQLAHWSNQGHVQPVSINLSEAQFSDRGLVERLFRLARACPPGTVELDVTESLLLARDARLLDTLARLREQGMRVAIDDFGTGYSSLALLKHLPIDTLKIDRTFIREIGREHTTELLIRTIIGLGHGLGLRLVAEGVETEEQFAFLAREGCDAMQGFLFQSPIPASEFVPEGLTPVTSHVALGRDSP